MNNCPSCKNVIAELKMSTIKGKLPPAPAFDCVTLCCSHCGVILMVVPDLAGGPGRQTSAPNGH